MSLFKKFLILTALPFVIILGVFIFSKKNFKLIEKTKTRIKQLRAESKILLFSPINFDSKCFIIKTLEKEIIAKYTIVKKVISLFKTDHKLSFFCITITGKIMSNGDNQNNKKD